MNACVRAVVRTGLELGHEIVGIRRGYKGLLDEDFFINQQGERVMTARSVSAWSRQGGALLRSSRSEEFRTVEGRQKAAEILRRHKIAALVPIGGDGTFHGAVELSKLWDGRIVGCPGTIDNDLIGTDFTIGFSTAVNTAVEAVDKIRDTAESHERMFLIEVMGRHSGHIAGHTALASGSEVVCMPETLDDLDGIVAKLRDLQGRGKSSIMMIVAEGDENGGAVLLDQKLKAAGNPFPTKVAILGHLQRGGSPTPEDRILSSQLGYAAAKAIHAGQTNVMAGRVGGKTVYTPFEETYSQHKPFPGDFLDLIEALSR